MLKISVDCSYFDPVQFSSPRCPAAQFSLDRSISAAVTEQLLSCKSNQLGLEMVLDPRNLLPWVSAVTTGIPHRSLQSHCWWQLLVLQGWAPQPLCVFSYWPSVCIQNSSTLVLCETAFQLPITHAWVLYMHPASYQLLPAKEILKISEGKSEFTLFWSVPSISC